jgi:hypothetical protein
MIQHPAKLACPAVRSPQLRPAEGSPMAPGVTEITAMRFELFEYETRRTACHNETVTL